MLLKNNMQWKIKSMFGGLYFPIEHFKFKISFCEGCNEIKYYFDTF